MFLHWSKLDTEMFNGCQKASRLADTTREPRRVVTPHKGPGRQAGEDNWTEIIWPLLHFVLNWKFFLH